MNQISNQLLSNLLKNHSGPCLSLYQPTHRKSTEIKKDQICFKNLMKRLEKSLDGDSELNSVLEKLHALSEDIEFWNHRTEGLAIFANQNLFEILDLRVSVAEEVFVSNSFHLTPIINLLQSADKFQILALSLHEAKLYEGSRIMLEQIKPLKFPHTITEALGADLTEPHETVASYGGVGGGSDPMHHGHGSKSEESEKDRDRFFRFIDKNVLDHYSKQSSLPLILAALPEHQSHFHELSKNPFLIKEGIKKDPKLLKAEDLREAGWAIIKPRYEKRLAEVASKYQKANAAKLASDNLSEITKAAINGRIDTLLLESERKILANGEWQDLNHSNSITGNGSDKERDISDVLAEMVLKTNGDVIVLPPDKMPSTSGLAAVYRF